MNRDSTVLIVDDDPTITDEFASWLADEHDVRTAYDGDGALDAVDESVDVVVLDRVMPDRSGAAVLEAIRKRGYDCRVAMVTGVEPDVDIADMGFDAYLVKPIDPDRLRRTVESLLDRATYEDEMQRFFSLAARRAALETHLSPAEREQSEEYAALLERLEEARQSATVAVQELDNEALRASLRSRQPSGTDDADPA